VKRRESEGDKNRDKKVVMVKLIIQKKNLPKNARYCNNSKVSLVKFCSFSFGVQSWCWHESRSSDLVSVCDWLVSRIWFLLSTGKFAIGC
jgi:hypothetical protein